MNNQQAINLLKGLEKNLDDYCELNDEGKTAFSMAISALNCSEIPNNSDTISRQQAIDFVGSMNMCDEISNEVCKKLTSYLDELPSAQPETAKRIVGKSRDGMTLWYQCDTCNEPVDEHDNFCRGCGRRLIDETD